MEITVEGERPQRQTAYEVLMASSAAVLDGNHGDLWDSGKVVSDQLLSIPYGGIALTSTKQVFWKVRVWDRNDQPSAWSSVATWTMGLLNPADWQASWICAPSNSLTLTGCAWIWYPEGNPASSAPPGVRYFRKTVSVRSDSALTAATLLLAVDNSYTAYVNGGSVVAGNGGIGVRPPSSVAVLESDRSPRNRTHRQIRCCARGRAHTAKARSRRR